MSLSRDCGRWERRMLVGLFLWRLLRCDDCEYGGFLWKNGGKGAKERG